MNKLIRRFYPKGVININMRCIEILIVNCCVVVKLMININMRCIEILDRLLVMNVIRHD